MDSDTHQMLDHGYVRLVETWGSDERIVEAARMSTGKGFNGWGPFHHEQCETGQSLSVCACAKREGDEKLLRYLWKNRHHTPFEMAGLTFEAQAPIFVFREWHRHRVPFGYNEQSARYVEMPELFYVPSAERLRDGAQGKANKQGSEAARFSDADVELFRERIEKTQRQAFAEYRALLEQGVARELARVVLPVGTYSKMRATGNLRGWLAFLSLRLPKNVQWEMRQYADAVSGLLSVRFPRTAELFHEGRE